MDLVYSLGCYFMVTVVCGAVLVALFSSLVCYIETSHNDLCKMENTVPFLSF